METIKNNKGNTIVIVIVSIVGVLILAGGIFGYIGYKEQQRRNLVIDQVNAYEDKFKELDKDFEKLGNAFENANSVTPTIRNEMKSVSNRVKEIKDLTLPEEIKEDAEKCIDATEELVGAFEEFVSSADIPNPNMITSAEQQRLMTALRNLPVKKDSFDKICEESTKDYTKRLKDEGYTREKK